MRKAIADDVPYGAFGREARPAWRDVLVMRVPDEDVEEVLERNVSTKAGRQKETHLATHVRITEAWAGTRGDAYLAIEAHEVVVGVVLVRRIEVLEGRRGRRGADSIRVL
jgi:hypothetical protein